jgi:hypothetical protein
MGGGDCPGPCAPHACAQPTDQVQRDKTVEGLYCKRPIQCLPSSELLTPPPPRCPASLYPLAFGAGGGQTGWVEGGGGVGVNTVVRKTPDTALYSIYVSTLWIRPIEGNAKSLRRKSNLHKEFAAAVYLSEGLSLLDFCPVKQCCRFLNLLPYTER